MKNYDKELMFKAKFEVELQENGEITKATLLEYKNFVQSNFACEKSVEKYLLQEPLNVVISTKDDVKIHSTIKNIREILPNLVDVEDKIISFLTSIRLREFGKLSEELDNLTKVKTENVFIDIVFKRFLLLTFIAQKDVVKIKEYSSKLKLAWEQKDLIDEKITWTVGNFDV